MGNMTTNKLKIGENQLAQESYKNHDFLPNRPIIVKSSDVKPSNLWF